MADLPDRVCVHCKDAYRPRCARQLTCGSRACKKRQHYLKHRESPAYVEKNRRRSRDWYARQRGAEAIATNPWLAGAPTVGPRLPGGLITIAVSPARSVQLKDTRVLHGAISSILGDLGVGHEKTKPTFTLRPSATSLGWSLYVWTDDAFEVLRNVVDTRLLGDARTTFTFGAGERAPAPVVEDRGRRALALSTLSPTIHHCTTITGKKCRTPTSETLVGSLQQTFMHLTGVRVMRDQIMIEVAEQHIDAVDRLMGGKFRMEDGWDGVLRLRCNAVAEYMLRIAETIGLGSRVGFGFGAVRVRPWNGEPTHAGAQGRWFITPHAVEQYVARAMRGRGRHEEALVALIDESRGARFLKLLDSGAELWRGPRPGRLRYVVGPGEGGLKALVTVLAPGDGGSRC